MKKSVQPWLSSPPRELVFIIAPLFIPVAAVLLFEDYFVSAKVSTLWWILLVLCIDVSHVYSTLFRLYWDKETFVTHKRLLILIPAIGFTAALVIHLYSPMLFWRILAYIAVFHFIRQQYGFMRLYSRREKSTKVNKMIDAIAIYAATLYPIIYWHIYATDKLAWFVAGDFFSLQLTSYGPILQASYLAIIAIYIVKEMVLVKREKQFNIPRNLIISGTFASWYIGIVAFQADLVFTLLNVVSHGIPYMALIWLHGERRSSASFRFSGAGLGIFVVVLLILAYAEENLWDSFVWKDRPEIFLSLTNGPLQNPLVVSVAVALLVLPQLTHYVLDGYIWRFSTDQSARLNESG